MLTLEDNYGGGFGSGVADSLVKYGGPFSLKQLFVRQIPESDRTPDNVLRHLGLPVEDMLKAPIEIIAFIATYPQLAEEESSCVMKSTPSSRHRKH